MAPKRRHADGTAPSGTTAVVLVASGDTEPDAVALACRLAVRETDAVLTRGENGVISLLLRSLRDGAADTKVIIGRIRDQCLAATGAPVRVGVAVSEHDGEPLDLLLRRAEDDLGTADLAAQG